MNYDIFVHVHKQLLYLSIDGNQMTLLFQCYVISYKFRALMSCTLHPVAYFIFFIPIFRHFDVFKRGDRWKFNHSNKNWIERKKEWKETNKNQQKKKWKNHENVHAFMSYCLIFNSNTALHTTIILCTYSTGFACKSVVRGIFFYFQFFFSFFVFLRSLLILSLKQVSSIQIFCIRFQFVG